jgi:hypothetical protein
MSRKESQESFHLSDRDLLLWADGELSPQRAAGIRRHLSACWTCRTRMAELEHAIADFVQCYRRELDARLPSAEGPRALLKARLAERTASSGAGRNIWLTRMRPVRAASVLAAFVLLTGVAIRLSRHGNVRSQARETYMVANLGEIPDTNLTPGATNPIGIWDVCSANVSTNDPAVPDPLKREVLKEYGLNEVAANGYEIDYLVTPQLGGAANIRNLWPQPSRNTVWNARVKDALEDRLHYLVCSGQVNLATAQREISQDWVAAYKKYFRTKEPLQEHSGRKQIGMQRRDVPFPLVAMRG